MKPDTLKDLLAGGHIELGEVKKIAKTIFDGETTAAGPEGYVITAVDFDDLPDACQQFVVKAILEFRVNNILDLDEPEDIENIPAIEFSEDDRFI